MPQICLATTNQGKLAEFKAYLEPLGYNIICLDNNYPDVPETGLTFVENALIKARAACDYYQMPVLADDSGICVPALNGAPGIYSARYAGADTTAEKNIQHLLTQMAHLKGEQRHAYFYGALVLMQHANDPCPHIVTDSWHGTILETRPAANHGFGYDPIFYLPEHHCTAADLTQTEKNQISHRGKGLAKLQSLLSL